MPSIKIVTPLLGGNYYHVFNRGVNRQVIFFQKKNYYYFLNLMGRFLFDYVDILAYSLLPNHFHLVIRVKNQIVISSTNQNLNKNTFLTTTNEIKIGQIVSNQFKRLFITYAMGINKQENRTGALFDAKFKRLLIDKHKYLEYAIFYVHHNPLQHKISDNFKTYRFSSFKAIASEKETKINRKLVFDIFGDKHNFELFHDGWHIENQNLILE